jgi:predicted dehydrogenase
MSMRFGLVGTGYWAQVTHAPALASTEGVELAAVWGRRPAAAAELAAQYHAVACDDVGEMLDMVDAVAFSVPPDVQAPIAARAARAGKHLLLEKPIAVSLAQGEELAAAVSQAKVASVVFFTARFQPEVRAWLDGVRAQGPWLGGTAVWLGDALEESNPFNTAWRREKGGLWDLGPHVISLLWASLGPVARVSADAGRGDLTYLVLHHEDGATSTATLTLGAPASVAGFEFSLWGEPGRSTAPTSAVESLPALRTALSELAASAASGRPHPCDVHFGLDILRVLADAQQQLDGRKRSG